MIYKIKVSLWLREPGGEGAAKRDTYDAFVLTLSVDDRGGQPLWHQAGFACAEDAEAAGLAYIKARGYVFVPPARLVLGNV